MATLAELAAGVVNRGASRAKTNVRPIPTKPAAQKLINTSNKFGAKGIANQQATTRVIYDSLKLAVGGSSVLTFFQNASTRQYPLTNLQENKLQEGESLAIEKIYFSILKTTIGDPTDVIDSVLIYVNAEFAGLYASELDLIFDKSTVLTKLPLTSIQSQLNGSAKFATQDVKEMDSDLVIPPLMVFKALLTIPKITALPAGFDWYLRMNMEGLGTIFSAKGTF